MNADRVSADSVPVAARVAEQHSANDIDGPRKRRGPALAPRIVAGALFIGVVVLIAGVAAWPIYRDGAFLLLVGLSALVAAAIAALAWSRRWGGWPVAGLVAVAFFVLGIPLAVPSRLGGATELVRGLAEVAGGALFAWKDLTHRRSAGRHVPQPARPGADRVPRRHLRGTAAVVAGRSRGVRRRSGRTRDDLRSACSSAAPRSAPRSPSAR